MRGDFHKMKQLFEQKKVQYMHMSVSFFGGEMSKINQLLMKGSGLCHGNLRYPPQSYPPINKAL